MIGLVTDFGSQAGYVASMKGVILSIDPTCSLVDLSHDISPQNIVEAAFFLDNCCLYFPNGFIFVIVVDPGVGTNRRILCVETKQKHQYFIAPDNGVLDLVVKEQGIAWAISIENRAFWRETTSHTFHGRDIMAPVAAHVSKGTSIDRLGPSIDPESMMRLVLPTESYIDADGMIHAFMLYADRFGNVITNLREELFGLLPVPLVPPITLKVRMVNQDGKIQGEVIVPFHRVYADVPPGELLCLFNSENRFEIAMNQGNAAIHLETSNQQEFQLSIGHDSKK